MRHRHNKKTEPCRTLGVQVLSALIVDHLAGK